MTDLQDRAAPDGADADFAEAFAALGAVFAGRRVLLLEDEAPLAAHVEGKLLKAGFAAVDRVESGEAAIEAASRQAYDLLILDRITLGLDGLSALRAIRAGDGPAAQAPALFLTALGGEQQRIEGLLSGADDYVAKPVGDEELLARVAAQLRRRPKEGGSPADIVNGPFRLQPGPRVVTFTPPGQAARVLDLSPLEFAILAELMGAGGQPVTKTMLWDRCWVEWKFLPDNFVNIIDARISALRRRLKDQCAELPEAFHPLIVSARSQSLVFRRLDGLAQG